MTQVSDFGALMAAIDANKGRIADDHSCDSHIGIAGIALMTRGDRQPVPVALFNAAYYSLNEVYFGDNNEPRLSTSSVGGVVKKFSLSTEDAVKAYNESQVSNLFTPSFISSVHLLVDGKLVPSDMVSETDLETLNNRAALHKQVKEQRTDVYRASES